MTDQPCGICPKPTRDASYVCDPCGDSFATDLKALIDWLHEDLETSVSGAAGVQYRAGRSTGGEPGLRVNWRATELYRDLQRALAATVEHCQRVGSRHTSPRDDQPRPTIPSMALWLTWRVDGLCLDPEGPALIGAVQRLVDKAGEIVFWVPPERRFLGPCELCGGGHLYAEGEATEAICNRCEAAFPAEARRSKMLAELDDQLLTAAKIAMLSTYLGLSKDRERVRKLVNQWAKRKRITAHGEGDAATFRFGEVWRMLIVDDAMVTNVAL